MNARAIFITVVTAASTACTIYADPVTTQDLAENGAICSAKTPELGDGCNGNQDAISGAITASICEYGGNADLACNTIMTCALGGDSLTGFAWAIAETPQTQSLVCATTNICPKLRAAIQDGASCDLPASGGPTTALQYMCAYPDGTCGCTTSGGTSTWKCISAPKAPCPPTRPGIGQYCEQENLSCDYGACLFEHSAAMICSAKSWQIANTACP